MIPSMEGYALLQYFNYSFEHKSGELVTSFLGKFVLWVALVLTEWKKRRPLVSKFDCYLPSFMAYLTARTTKLASRKTRNHVSMLDPHVQLNHAIQPRFYLFIYPPNTSLHHIKHPSSLSLFFSPLSIEKRKMASSSLSLFFLFSLLSPILIASSPVQDPELVVQEVHR